MNAKYLISLVSRPKGRTLLWNSHRDRMALYSDCASWEVGILTQFLFLAKTLELSQSLRQNGGSWTV